MAVRKLLASTGAGVAIALGVITAPAQATQAHAPVSNVGILSCPPGASAAAPGYRCLSLYSTEAQCNAGILRNIEATPATRGYCRRSGVSWWGYVNY
ncbi:hypothetical protein ACH5A7_30885 [Streptomyces sp. NPDC018955]|uniref:hypothetical protein n=1 Tax=Streptomyces sp. NPDC018955 TaxID=3365055 RepID=UPI00378D182A